MSTISELSGDTCRVIDGFCAANVPLNLNAEDDETLLEIAENKGNAVAVNYIKECLYKQKLPEASILESVSNLSFDNTKF